MKLVPGACRNAGSFFSEKLFLSFVFTLLLLSMQPHLFPNLVGPTGHNLQRFAELLVILAACLLLVLKRCRASAKALIQGFSSRFIYLLIILFSLAIISSILSEYSARSFQDAGLFAALFILTLAVTHSIRVTGIESYFVFICAGIACYTLIKLLMLLAVSMSHPVLLSERAVIDGFSNVRSFNHIQVFLIPGLAAAAVMMAVNSRRYLLFFIALLIAQFVLLFYSQGRGVLISLLCAFFLFYPLYRRNVDARHICYVFAIASVLGFLVYYFLFVLWPDFYNHFSANYVERFKVGDSGRMSLWRTALRNMLEAPFFGQGGQSFVLLQHTPPLGSAHNFVLTLLVEYGVGVVAIVILLFAKLVFSFFEKARGDTSSLQAILLLSLVAAMLYSFLTGMFISPLSQILTAIALGNFMAFGERKSFDTADINRPHAMLLMSLAAFLSTLYVAYTIIDLLFYRDYLTDCLGARVCYPRFWLNGNFYAL